MRNKRNTDNLDQTDTFCSTACRPMPASLTALASRHLLPAPGSVPGARPKHPERSALCDAARPEAVGLTSDLHPGEPPDKQASAGKAFEETIDSYPGGDGGYPMTGDSDYLLRGGAGSRCRVIVDRLARILHVFNIRSSATLKQVIQNGTADRPGRSVPSPGGPRGPPQDVLKPLAHRRRSV